MACACTRRKRGARGHARRLVSGGVGEIAAPVAGRGSSPRGGVSPAPSGCSSAVRCSVETSVGCSSGEGAAWWQPTTDGGRAGWGVYPRAKPAPRWHGCHRPRPVAWWQALDAQRRRLPRWGSENGGERIRSARSLRRGGRCAGRQDAAAANERRGPYRSGCGRLPPSASDWQRPQGLPHARRVVSPLNAVWQAGAGPGMACACTRRE